MTPKQRQRVIRLSEKLNKNPAYAKKLGIKVETKKSKTHKED